jgi:hypothetical protein
MVVEVIEQCRKYKRIMPNEWVITTNEREDFPGDDW